MMVAVIGLRNPVTPDDGKIIFAMSKFLREIWRC